jgi:ribose 5-phosphate isomerase B
VIGITTAEKVVEAFLGAEYSGEERHNRRLSKITAAEERF